jgi:hypothetical protein
MVFSPSRTQTRGSKEFKEAISYGVVKVNVDTDMQYAYLTGVRDFVLNNVGGRTGLLLDVLLVLREELGVELDVAGLVDTVKSTTRMLTTTPSTLSPRTSWPSRTPSPLSAPTSPDTDLL